MRTSSQPSLEHARPRYGLATYASRLLVSISILAVCGCQRPLEPVTKVILVTIDTLRADRLGCYGYSAQPTSPALDVWSQRSLVFERAFAQAPWTVPSMGSLLAGRYPRGAGVYTNRGDIRKDRRTLPELFREHGYRTASFTTNPLVMRPGFRRGFEHAVPESSGKKIPFSVTEPLVMQWLDEHAREKFFIWIHNTDPHSPRTEGNRYLTEPGWKPYDAEVRWVDEAMGRLFAKLDALGIADQSLIIFTADHGEAFGEHKIGGHQNGIYDEVLRVPLMMRYPGMRRNTRVTEPVEVIDLFPTILELAGLPIPSDTRGESLVPIAQGRTESRKKQYAYSARYYFATDQMDPVTGDPLFRTGEHHLAARDREWTLIAKVPGAPTDQFTVPDWDLAAPAARFELYNTLADPREMQNLVTAHADVRWRLSAALDAFRRVTAGEGQPHVGTTQVDEATLETLRQLGYQ